MTPRFFAATVLLTALGACSHDASAPRPRSAAAATPASPLEAAVQLLDQGERDKAHKLVRAALKSNPGDPSLQLLRDSIERDPKDLLGPESWPYTARAGDTMSGLAERFLGNRLKAYQLARYNGIAVPQSLAAGQVVNIPGPPPRVAIPRKPAPATPVPTAAAKPKLAPARTPELTTNPAGAQRLRAAGLAALNAGQPGRALLALRRAAALDPGNPLVARDLARAQRIAAAVQARR